MNRRPLALYKLGLSGRCQLWGGLLSATLWIAIVAGVAALL